MRQSFSNTCLNWASDNSEEFSNYARTYNCPEACNIRILSDFRRAHLYVALFVSFLPHQKIPRFSDNPKCSIIFTIHIIFSKLQKELFKNICRKTTNFSFKAIKQNQQFKTNKATHFLQTQKFKYQQSQTE